MHHSLWSYFCAILSLAGISPLLHVAQRSDLKLSRRRHADTQAVPPNIKAEIDALTKRRCAALRRKTLLSLTWVLSAIAAAYLVFIQHFDLASMTRQQAFSVASVVAFAWATLGRLGWSEQSYKGVTIYERLDTFLFWGFYWFGTFFGVVAVSNA